MKNVVNLPKAKRRLQASLVLPLAFMATGCRTNIVTPYPSHWGAAQPDATQRCDIAGKYSNVGEIERYGRSNASRFAYLDALLLEGETGPISGGLVKSVTIQAQNLGLLVDFENENATSQAAKPIVLDECNKDGFYTLKFSSQVQSEYSGIVERRVTLNLMSATDGSLFGRSEIEFISKGALFRRNHTSVVWYRFIRDSK